MNNKLFTLLKVLSGRRDSNSRPSAWKADALPTELFPQSVARDGSRVVSVEMWWREEDLNLRRLAPADLQSAPFNHSGIPPNKSTNFKRTNVWS